MKLLARAADACPPGAAAGLPGPRVEGVPAAVLAKEAVYAAAAATSYDLHDYVDFGPWFRGSLLQARTIKVLVFVGDLSIHRSIIRLLCVMSWICLVKQQCTQPRESLLQTKHFFQCKPCAGG